MTTQLFSKFATLLFTATTFGTVATGCGSIQDDRIESICSCEVCGERELEERTIEVEAEWEVASAYSCEDILEPYWDCQLQKHECKNDEYKDDNDECAEDLDEYRQCLVAQSTRKGDPY